MDDGVIPTDRRAAPRAPTATSERRRAADIAVDNGGPTNGEPGVAAALPVERRKSPRPRKPDRAAAVTVADRIDPLMAASVEVVEPDSAPRKRKSRPAQPSAPKQSPTTRVVLTPDDLRFEEHGERVVARQPYVLPKIIPGEPDVPQPEPESENETELKPAQKVSDSAFKPQFLRMTKKLARSLQPVIVARHRPRVRRVTRVVRHIDTWSVFKIALLFNVFLYAVCLMAGVMLWRVAVNTGTIDNVERFFESFGWQIFELKGGEIYHNAWIAGLFAVIGLTGLAVLAATMFNLITDLVGGVRLTVLEEEVVERKPRVSTWPRLPRRPPPSAPPTAS